MKIKKEKGKALRIAAVFLVIVLSLILISLLFKLVFIIKNSTFDGQHRYNLAFVGTNKSYVLSFSPETESISFLTFLGKIKDNNNFNRIFDLPLDAVVKTANLQEGNFDINKTLYGRFLHSLSSNSKPTFIDLIRMILFSNTVSADSIIQKRMLANEDELRKQQIISSAFLDNSIIKEKKTVEVINATEISGLGARAATILNNIGTDIVLIVTSDKTENNSRIIYYGDESYTVKKIADIFNFPIEKRRDQSIADVIIIIGRDKISSEGF